MNAPIEVSFHHFESTDRIRAKIDELIEGLDKFDGVITSGRVVVDGVQKHGHKTVVDVKVELSYPGGVAVGKRSGEFPSPSGQKDFDTALVQSFHAATSQIKSSFEKRQPQETKQLNFQPERGRIDRLDKGLKNGFVALMNGESLFFSADVLKGDFTQLAIGDEVLAIPSAVEGAYGPQASSIKPTGPLG